MAAAIAASEAEAAETARLRRGEELVLARALAESVAEAAVAEAAPLYTAARCGREADVAALLAGGGDVNELDPDGSGKTALCAACENAHIEVVTVLIDAGAKVNQAANDGRTPLFAACVESCYSPQDSQTVVAKLLAAGANVNQATNRATTPLYVACARGHLGIAQLLSAYGARRTFPASRGTAEDRAVYRDGGGVPPMVAEERRVRHQELVDWLVRTRLWSTALHHLEFLTAERTRFLLRAGDNIHAAAEPGGPTPLSIAQDLAAAARPVIHSAFLVLEAAKPWSRETHHLFPAAARARAEELWPTGFRLSRQLPEEEQHTMYEHVWMTIVMPREVTRDYTPPPAPFAARRARLEAAEAKAFTAAAEAAREATGADAAASGAGSRSTRRRARRRSRGTRPEGGEWCVL